MDARRFDDSPPRKFPIHISLLPLVALVGLESAEDLLADVNAEGESEAGYDCHVQHVECVEVAFVVELDLVHDEEWLPVEFERHFVEVNFEAVGLLFDVQELQDVPCAEVA